VRTPLDELERTLDPDVFVRIHRSYIVRMDRVSVLQRRVRGGAEVIMPGGVALPVSRRRRARVSALFGGLNLTRARRDPRLRLRREPVDESARRTD
jgi:DNA-binding LytR/AlgR family response regulator